MSTTHNTGNESTLDKIKEKLHIGGHKDTTTTTSTTHTTGATGTTHNTTGHGTSTNAGPHDSNLTNKADPRVDSDRDNRANPASHVGGTTGHNTTGAGYNTTGHGTSTNAGPHDSNLANKADPRIDSDRDGRSGAGYGTTGTHTGATHTGAHTGATGTGYGSTGTGYGSTGTSTNAGPHNSNALNKADPRVDSDRDNRANPTSHAGAGYGTTGTHTGTSGTHAGNHGLTGQTGTHNTGGLSNSTNAGPHDSNVANKADPRVDSDLDGKGNRHGASTGGVFGASGSHATHGSGTAQNTDGPHNSDMLNKIDPRVDSDRDGSKTVGGNKTHA